MIPHDQKLQLLRLEYRVRRLERALGIVSIPQLRRPTTYRALRSEPREEARPAADETERPRRVVRHA